MTTHDPGKSVADGQVRAVDDRTIEVTVDGKRYLLSRYCPHEGADLSFGYVQDGKLHCPWHNLCFDVRTGHQPCRSLKDLRVVGSGSGA